MEEKEIKLLTIACLIAFFLVGGAYAYTFFNGINQALALNSSMSSTPNVSNSSNSANVTQDTSKSTSSITNNHANTSKSTSNTQSIISAQAAKNIAESLDAQPDTTVGTPQLSTLNGKPVYYVTFYDQSGSGVARVIIDAKTGADMGEG